MRSSFHSDWLSLQFLLGSSHVFVTAHTEIVMIHNPHNKKKKKLPLELDICCWTHSGINFLINGFGWCIDLSTSANMASGKKCECEAIKNRFAKGQFLWKELAVNLRFFFAAENGWQLRDHLNKLRKKIIAGSNHLNSANKNTTWIVYWTRHAF